MPYGLPSATPAGVPLDVVAAIGAALSVILDGPAHIRTIRTVAGRAASAAGPSPWALAGRLDQHRARRIR